MGRGAFEAASHRVGRDRWRRAMAEGDGGGRWRRALAEGRSGHIGTRPEIGRPPVLPMALPRPVCIVSVCMVAIVGGRHAGDTAPLLLPPHGYHMATTCNDMAQVGCRHTRQCGRSE